MWCKTCNIETNEELCPVCGSTTIEDIPTEVYWCAHCETPVIQAATQAETRFVKGILFSKIQFQNHYMNESVLFRV